MTLSKTPIEPSEMYALMGAEALLAHLKAVTAALGNSGVEITARARCGIDEIEECVVEHFARSDRDALRRHLAVEKATEKVPGAANANHAANNTEGAH